MRASDDDGPGGSASLPAEDIGKIQLLILLALGAAAVYPLGLLLWPFLPAIVTSAVVAALIYPAYRKFEEWLGQRDIAAFIGTAAIFFLLVLPLVGLTLILADQIRYGIAWASGQAEGLLAPGGRLQAWLEAASGYLGLEGTRFADTLNQQVEEIMSVLAGRTLTFLSGLGGWLLQAGAALFTLFYLLRDADGLLGAVKWLIPLDETNTERLVDRAREVIYATVYGNVVVALVQGILGGLAFWILGIPAAALWGTLMGLLSLLPALAASIVWVPAGVILIAQDEVTRGIVLLGIGAVVISTVDNYLRAVVVGDRAQLHSLVVFFSVLGGLFTFGAVGIFVGPVLFVLALTLIEMARLALEPETRLGAVATGGLLPTRPAREGRGEGGGGPWEEERARAERAAVDEAPTGGGAGGG